MTEKSKGGARAGAGAPLKYGETMIKVTIPIPKSSKKIVHKAVKDVLKDFEVKYVIENHFGLYLSQHKGKDCSFTTDTEAATIFRTEEIATKHISRLPIELRGKLKVKKL